jgi:Na+-driven multidrug efflux pump
MCYRSVALALFARNAGEDLRDMRSDAGAGDNEGAATTLSQALTAALALGVLSAAALEVFAPSILSAMGTSVDALGDAQGAV